MKPYIERLTETCDRIVKKKDKEIERLGGIIRTNIIEFGRLKKEKEWAIVQLVLRGMCSTKERVLEEMQQALKE